MKVVSVIGARPQFVKAAMLSQALNSMDNPPFEDILIHTGQHYDQMMSDVFFQELQITPPKINLEVGSGSPGKQLGIMLDRLEEAVKQLAPDLLLVYGDTNSTLATAIIADQQNIPLVHVEGGERIYRRFDVPEEINRILTDHTARLVLASTKRAVENLKREGFARDRVKFVGDPMYDLFCWGKSMVADKAKISPSTFNVKPNGYHLATVHRAQNTTDINILLKVLAALDQSSLPVLLPVHPRVNAMLKQHDWTPENSLKLIEPLGYFDFLNILLNAGKVFTDSGGVTREAFFAGKPCIIPMENSWWVEIVEAGWAIETGLDQDKILDSLENYTPVNERPEGLFGDGNSAKAIIDALVSLDTSRKEGDWHIHGSYLDIPTSKPSSFTYKNYENILGTFQQAGYKFKPFSAITNENSDLNFYLRHDIDFDVEKALRMAEVEHEMGIKATYFFMIRTEHYNIFSYENSEKIRQILNMGHFLALHFDCACYPEDFHEDQLASACNKEVELLETWFNHKVDIISYHRPNQKVLSGSPALSGNVPHTYMEDYTKEVAYISDSKGGWHYGHPLEMEAFKKKKPVHMLVHPIWWNEQPRSPYQTLLSYIQDKNAKLEKSVALNNKVYQIGPFKNMEVS